MDLGTREKLGAGTRRSPELHGRHWLSTHGNQAHVEALGSLIRAAEAIIMRNLTGSPPCQPRHRDAVPAFASSRSTSPHRPSSRMVQPR